MLERGESRERNAGTGRGTDGRQETKEVRRSYEKGSEKKQGSISCQMRATTGTVIAKLVRWAGVQERPTIRHGIHMSMRTATVLAFCSVVQHRKRYRVK